MRHAADQVPDGFHLLGLPDAGFQALALGDVLHQAVGMLGRAAGVLFRPAAHPNPAHLAIRAADATLEIPAGLPRFRLPELPIHLRTVLGQHVFEEALIRPVGLRRLVAENPAVHQGLLDRALRKIQLPGPGPSRFQGELQACFALPQRLLQAVFVERQLDVGLQLADFKGFQDVAQRFSQFGPLQRLIFRKRTDEERGDVEPLPDFAGGDNAIHVTFEMNVHQDQIGPEFPGQGGGGRPGGDRAHRLIAQALELLVEVDRGNAFVFDNQDAACGHRCRHRVQGVGSDGLGKRIWTAVPEARSKVTVPCN